MLNALVLPGTTGLLPASRKTMLSWAGLAPMAVPASSKAAAEISPSLNLPVDELVDLFIILDLLL
jgi:hypothetical protein